VGFIGKVVCCNFLLAVRFVLCEVLRLAVDCSVLEIPPLDSMGKEKLLRSLGKKLEVGLYSRLGRLCKEVKFAFEFAYVE
jgi:hypothetical protein